ncbi:Os08g0378100 [Oryza sativa Japonica Group]|uniref:Os08g0378100 protein n=1 Tax=Oryza sativa subsp. japonica TaxID=39947 RepID=Q7EYN4_ORYSJ|nr:unknown protein [Oryza sativa Japonica Group]BAF23599.1 Os08g0378100 [Oryza sativa Japonica Group]|eukprot:NP_001061685.1 Os08g0378100 [Oryza sativa Japonica Group]
MGPREGLIVACGGRRWRPPFRWEGRRRIGAVSFPPPDLAVGRAQWEGSRRWPGVPATVAAVRR